MADESRKRKRESEEVEDEVGEYTSSMNIINNHAEALINIIANPSLRISGANQKEIRRVLKAITDQAVIQNNAINTLTG